MKMKCLSVRPPWVEAIFEAGKDVENRTWTTDYRGLLLIHAAKKVDRQALAKFGLSGAIHTGVILGVVELTDVVEDSPSKWAEPDSFHWLLANARRFDEPIPYAGTLGLFEVEIPNRVLEKARKAAR